MIRTGIDIVEIERFRKTCRRSGDAFIKKIFRPEETQERDDDSLAGVFAAKEALIKALGLDAGSWLDISISKKENGKPVASISVPEKRIEGKIKSLDISISHSGGYAVASVVVEFV